MLTTTDRNWLQQQKAAMLSAAGRANVYSGALAAFHDKPEPLWRPIKRARKTSEARRLRRLAALWDAETLRRVAVIDSWVGVYRITTGPDREPFAAGGHLEPRAEKRVSSPWDHMAA